MTKTEWIAKLEYLASTSKDLTGDCLSLFEDLWTTVNFSYNHPSFIGYGPFGPEILAEIQDAKRRKAIKDTARYLRQKKYIQQSRKGAQIVQELTSSGQVRALKAHIRSSRENLSDGEYCIVTFDIPEDTRITRQYVRRTLRACGFQPHQLSVWISDKNVCDEMCKLVKHLKAERWVSVFRGSLQ